MNPNRHLRNLQSGADATFGRLGETPPDSTASFLGRVFAETAIPTTAGRIVMVHPVEIDGGQDEGDVPTFTEDPTRAISVVPLGSSAPVVGDYLDVFGVGGRWVAETGCGAVEDADCPGGGELCVTLDSTCGGDSNGFSVVVRPHGSGTIVASGSTPTSGPPGSSVRTICFTLPPGSYDVTATKTGCDSFTWADQSLACGETKTLAGTALCYSGPAIIFTVRGCSSAPLPDAVVTITGPGAFSGSATTDGDGKAMFITELTGSFSWTVTHPSGRFNPASGSNSKSAKCTAANVGVTLTPATGYVCCSVGSYWPTASPYPIPRALFMTDGNGFTMPITLGATGCNGTACEMRDMDDSSASDPFTYACTDGLPLGSHPPLDIGVHSCAFFWDVQLGPPGTMFVRQHFAINSTSGMTYAADGYLTGKCSPDTKRMWRLAKSCVDASSLTQYTTSQASVTVNSVYPLNISFTFPPGAYGFGPVPSSDPVSGEPYTLSAVLHE